VAALHLYDFRAALLAESNVLTVAEFDQDVERLKDRLLQGTDADPVRIKIGNCQGLTQGGKHSIL
jgi:hypothetical protein